MSDIRILIVEDDPFIAMDIETAVAEQFGPAAELIVVDSVSQAQRAATAAKISCALLDIDVVGGKTFDVLNPSTGELITALPDLGVDETKAAIDAAASRIFRIQSSFVSWCNNRVYTIERKSRIR